MNNVKMDTRTEYAVTWHGKPDVTFSNAPAAFDYINRSVGEELSMSGQTRNREDYAVVTRQVVTLTTDWAPIEQEELH